MFPEVWLVNQIDIVGGIILGQVLCLVDAKDVDIFDFGRKQARTTVSLLPGRGLFLS